MQSGQTRNRSLYPEVGSSEVRRARRGQRQIHVLLFAAQWRHRQLIEARTQHSGSCSDKADSDTAMVLQWRVGLGAHQQASIVCAHAGVSSTPKTTGNENRAAPTSARFMRELTARRMSSRSCVRDDDNGRTGSAKQQAEATRAQNGNAAREPQQDDGRAGAPDTKQKRYTAADTGARSKNSDEACLFGGHAAIQRLVQPTGPQQRGIDQIGPASRSNNTRATHGRDQSAGTSEATRGGNTSKHRQRTRTRRLRSTPRDIDQSNRPSSTKNCEKTAERTVRRRRARRRQSGPPHRPAVSTNRHKARRQRESNGGEARARGQH